MKRLFTICLVACLFVLPLGCGSGDDAGTKSDTGTSSTDKGDDKGDGSDKK